MKTLLLSLLAGLTLAACGSSDNDNDPPTPKTETKVADGVFISPEWEYVIVDTPLGQLECVYADGARAGGPSCNWEKYNQQR